MFLAVLAIPASGASLVATAATFRPGQGPGRGRGDCQGGAVAAIPSRLWGSGRAGSLAHSGPGAEREWRPAEVTVALGVACLPGWGSGPLEGETPGRTLSRLGQGAAPGSAAGGSRNPTARRSELEKKACPGLALSLGERWGVWGRGRVDLLPTFLTLSRVCLFWRALGTPWR